MTRAVLAGIFLIPLVVVLTGCAHGTHDPEREDSAEETTEVQVDAPSQELAYEFAPYSTLDAVVGWPSSASTAAYFVSVPVETECHWLEATSLIGPAIAEAINIEQPESLEGLACGITPTPLADRDDVVDEVAWRVDDGMAALVAAYAATVSPDQALDCEPVEVPALAPGLGEVPRLLVRGAPGGRSVPRDCRADQPRHCSAAPH